MKFPKPAKREPKPRLPIRRSKRPAPLRVRASRGELRELADNFMSLYVRHKAGWTCWVCTSRRWEEMQMAHLFAKGPYPNGRYLEQNVRCLCKRCHRLYTDRPEEWRELLIEKLGEAEYQALWAVVQVRRGPIDYKLEVLHWHHKVLELEDELWKVQERLDELRRRGTVLGLLLR